MNKRVLRSVLAIALGWVAGFGSCVAILTVIALFNRETLTSDVQLSVGWLLVTLSVGFVCSIAGGFVTGVVAQRREMAHAVGLVFLILLLSVYFMSRNKNAAQVPNWYMVAGDISGIASTLLGGWLRMKQRILLDKGSAAMIRATDRARFPAAVLAAFITFVFVLVMGGVLAGAGSYLILDKLLTGPHPAKALIPCFFAVFLSGFLARYVFKKIVGVRASPASGGTANDGTET